VLVYTVKILVSYNITDQIRLKFKRSEKTKKSEIKIWDIVKLNKKEVKEEFIKDIAANVQNTQLQEAEDINEISNKMK
jgi:hypothetical protein